MSKPVLKLSTFVDRPIVEIDGNRFELYNRSELSVLDGALLGKWLNEMSELEDALKDVSDPPTAAEQQQAARHLELALKYVEKVTVDLPLETRFKLTGDHAAAIIFHFLGLPQRALAAEAMKALAAASPSPKSIGAASSQN